MNRVLNRIETKAFALLQDLNMTKLPIDVETIAERLRMVVEYEEFEGNLSGVLYRSGKHIIIGVNNSHTKERQRFTISHEIGHYLLHEPEPLHVDGAFYVKHRDERSSQANNEEEIQANAFAAALLMPTPLLRAAVNEVLPDGLDLASDDAIKALAKKFKVSQQALVIRLGRLGLLDAYYW